MEKAKKTQGTVLEHESSSITSIAIRAIQGKEKL